MEKSPFFLIHLPLAALSAAHAATERAADEPKPLAAGMSPCIFTERGVAPRI